MKRKITQKTIKYKYNIEMQYLYYEIIENLVKASSLELTSNNFDIKSIVISYDPRLYLGLLQSIAYMLLQKQKKTENRTFLIIFEANNRYDGPRHNAKDTIYLPTEIQTDLVLGERIPINSKIISTVEKLSNTKIQKKNGLFDNRSEIFSQLPFLKVLFPYFKIAPMIIGKIEKKESFDEIVDLFVSNQDIKKTIPIFITKWTKTKKAHATLEEYNQSLKIIQEGQLQTKKLFTNESLINICTQINKKQGNNLLNIYSQNDQDILGPDEFSEVYGTFGFT